MQNFIALGLVILLLGIFISAFAFIIRLVASIHHNITRHTFDSIYPKWMLRKLYRERPVMYIVSNTKENKSVMYIRPFKFSFASESDEFGFDINRSTQEKILKEYDKLCADVKERIRSKKSYYEVNKYTPTEMDMWEL